MYVYRGLVLDLDQSKAKNAESRQSTQISVSKSLCNAWAITQEKIRTVLVLLLSLFMWKIL